MESPTSGTAQKVYAFVYNDCVYESADRVISLHTTLRGAYESKQRYANSLFQERREDWRRFGRQFSVFSQRGEPVIREWERFAIIPYELNNP